MIACLTRVLEPNPRVLSIENSGAIQAQSISDQDQARAHLRSVTSRRVHGINGLNAEAVLTVLEREASAATLHGD